MIANLLLLLTAAIWGFGFVAQVLGMNYLEPFAFIGARFVLGALSLLPVIWYLQRQEITAGPGIGYLIYASRSPIPGNKLNEFISANRQVCIYGFTRQALEAFNKNVQKTPLETIEDIEILRFLELGFKVKCCKLSDSSIAVDVPEDVEAVEARISSYV